MKWSFKIGRMLGIDVYLHVTFLLILAFIGIASWMNTGSVDAVIGGVLFFLALFGCVLLHEYGHSLMARRYGIETRDITLLPIGGVARLERMPENPLQELWVALAGPAVNVGIAALLGTWMWLTGSWESVMTMDATSGSFAGRLLAVNVFLVLFNLIPAFPMDGGRVLRAVLALRMSYVRATRIAATIGQGMAFVFGFIGLFSNPFLLVIAFFVWIGATQEASATEMKATLSGLPVREAMLTDFRVLAPRDTLGHATRLLLDGSQQHFPVVENGLVVGILVHSRLFEVLRERGEWVTVAEAMTREFRTIDADDQLENAMTHCDPTLTAMPVLRGRRLVGLLTAENIGELMMIRSARAHLGALPPPLPPSNHCPDHTDTSRKIVTGPF